MQPNLRMVFENNLEALNQLTAVARAYLKPFGLGAKALFAVELILEEAATNVIHHAFGDEKPHLIAMKLAVRDREVHLKVADDGRPFNPLSVPRLDVNQPLVERLEGGLGIHLVRQMMNSMAYRREEGRNIFEIWIRDRDGNGNKGKDAV